MPHLCATFAHSQVLKPVDGVQPVALHLVCGGEGSGGWHIWAHSQIAQVLTIKHICTQVTLSGRSFSRGRYADLAAATMWTAKSQTCGQSASTCADPGDLCLVADLGTPDYDAVGVL